MKKQEVIILTAVGFLAVIVLGTLGAMLMRPSDKTPIPVATVAPEPTAVSADLQVADTEPLTVGSDVDQSAGVVEIDDIIEVDDSKVVGVSDELEVSETMEQPFGPRSATDDEPFLEDRPTPETKKFQDTIKTWRGWTDLEKLAYCEEVAKRINNPDSPGAELFWEMRKSIDQDSDALDKEELSDIAALVSMLLSDAALFASKGNGPDESASFAVGVRRFVPIVWSSDEDGFFSFSLYDAIDGTIVEANVVTKQSGSRSLWINPGIYYLSVNATGAWNVKMFRSNEQLDKIVEGLEK